MTDALDELIYLMNLERREGQVFQGDSLDIGTGRVYGGQVLAQALIAAQETVVAGRIIHSMHAYFLREGDYRVPIIYEVETVRNGRSFSTRRVTAVQHGRPIFITAASFQTIEEGLEYQPSMPDVTGPDSLTSLSEYDERGMSALSDKLHTLLKLSAPFDLKPVENLGAAPAPDPLRQLVWIKTTRAIPGDASLHRAILAYISDYGLVTTALRPHGLNFDSPSLQLASIDHGMWFHRPVRVDDWLLYACDPLTTGNARGLSRGSFFNREGELIATTMQEGLIRQRAE